MFRVVDADDTHMFSVSFFPHHPEVSKLLKVLDRFWEK